MVSACDSLANAAFVRHPVVGSMVRRALMQRWVGCRLRPGAEAAVCVSLFPVASSAVKSAKVLHAK